MSGVYCVHRTTVDGQGNLYLSDRDIAIRMGKRDSEMEWVKSVDVIDMITGEVIWCSTLNR